MKELEKGVKILRRDPAETQEEFKDDVCTEYCEFFEEFLLDDGVYNSLYSDILKCAALRGNKEDETIRSKLNTFTSKRVSKVIEISKQKAEAPIPDNAYYRALYNKYKESDKSPREMKQITNEFLSSIDALSREIDLTYDKITPSAIG